MQTFLPYKDFTATAKCLDYRRLGKQRVEAKQILNAICGLSMGWKNHPIVKMWADYQDALKLYHDIVIQEWINRRYNNNMPLLSVVDVSNIRYPWWLGSEELHASHRSNLLRKDPSYYKKFGWAEPDNLDYVWYSKKYIDEEESQQL